MLAEAQQVTLSPEQRTRLHELERTVEKSLASFLECGRALLEIRDSGLYKQYGSFEQYLTTRWGISYSRGKELIRSTQVAENLLCGPGAPGGDAPLSEDLSEQTLRPLSKLSPELQRGVWTLATHITEKPTHTIVSRLVRSIQTAISEGYGKPAPRTKRQEPENTIFMRVVYKVAAMEAVSPQIIVSSISDPAQAARCIVACKELARRCHFIVDELVEKFPGLS